MGLFAFIASVLLGLLGGAFNQIILSHFAKEIEEIAMTAVAGMGLTRNTVEVANMLNQGIIALDFVVGIVVFLVIFSFLTHKGG